MIMAGMLPKLVNLMADPKVHTIFGLNVFIFQANIFALLLFDGFIPGIELTIVQLWLLNYSGTPIDTVVLRFRFPW